MSNDHKAQVEAARDECKRRTDEFAKAVLENKGEVRTSFREYDEHHARMAAREAIDRLAALASTVDIDAAAQRLMMWPLPKDFGPDCGISFDGRKDDERNKNKTWPVGTNLFSVEQAKKMLEYVLAGASPAPAASEPARNLSARITSYLAGGGLFNPEMADHDAVRDLLIDCRAYLDNEPPPFRGSPVIEDSFRAPDKGRG